MKNSMLLLIDQMLESLKVLRQDVCESVEEALVAKEWKPFVFESPYWGNHPEYGYEDTVRRFFFAPSVDFSQWEETTFGHGTGYTNDDDTLFEEWLGALDENLFVEL
jgi:hypothetical protein